MYFAIGGRRTNSGLYRVTYTGAESTEPSRGGDAGDEARALRRSLEAFHGHADPKAVDAAWPHLGHPDRFIRYAARVAIEFQDPKDWQDRALAETNTQASLDGPAGPRPRRRQGPPAEAPRGPRPAAAGTAWTSRRSSRPCAC